MGYKHNSFTSQKPRGKYISPRPDIKNLFENEDIEKTGKIATGSAILLLFHLSKPKRPPKLTTVFNFQRS